MYNLRARINQSNI